MLKGTVGQKSVILSEGAAEVEGPAVLFDIFVGSAPQSSLNFGDDQPQKTRQKPYKTAKIELCDSPRDNPKHSGVICLAVSDSEPSLQGASRERPLCARARAYGVEAELIEDGDPLALHARVGVAIEAVRRGQGPRFLECMTYRWRDHVGPTEDRIHKYRPDVELDAKIDNDNLKIVGDLLPADVRSSIEAAVEKCVAEAIAFAEASAFPEDREVYDHVFSG